MSRSRATAPTALLVCRVLKHEVAGQRGLHRDLRGLEVADLAHHHHVGILAQDRAQAAREGHVHARC